MPEKPQFPIIMFLVAASKDLLIDGLVAAVLFLSATAALIPILGTAVGAVTGTMGVLLGIIAGFVYNVVFVLWFFFKPAARRKKMMARTAVRVAIAFGISFIPLIRLLIPEMMYLVWSTYRAEVKQWKKKRVQMQRALQIQVKKEAKRGRGAVAQARREGVVDYRERQRQRREVERIREQQELLARAA